MLGKVTIVSKDQEDCTEAGFPWAGESQEAWEIEIAGINKEQEKEVVFHIWK